MPSEYRVSTASCYAKFVNGETYNKSAEIKHVKEKLVDCVNHNQVLSTPFLLVAKLKLLVLITTMCLGACFCLIIWVCMIWNILIKEAFQNLLQIIKHLFIWKWSRTLNLLIDEFYLQTCSIKLWSSVCNRCYANLLHSSSFILSICLIELLIIELKTRTR